MEINTNLTPAGLVYIPVALRRELGRQIKIVPNTGAAVLFPQHAQLVHVLKSLEIIRADLLHRLELENEKGMVLNGKSAK